MEQADPLDDDPLRRIAAEKKKADSAFSTFLGKVWPWAFLVSGPFATALITPVVAEQRTVFGVFLATLAFSSGVAAFYLVVKTKCFGDAGGWGLVSLGALCLFAGSSLAIAIGHGMYDVPISFSKFGGTPWGWVFAYIDAAITTFGLLGAVLGAISGVLAGKWGAELLEE